MTHRHLLLLPGLALLFHGCNSSLLQSRVSEGTIEYALSFPGYDPNGLMAGMLPEKTTLAGDGKVAPRRASALPTLEKPLWWMVAMPLLPM